MNCKNCGAELKEDALFCGNCGMKTETEQPVYEAPAQEYYSNSQGEYHRESYNEYQEQGSYQPPVMPEYPAEPVVPAEKPNTILWIVLSALQTFLCSPVTGIISLIFSIIANSSAENGNFAEAERKLKAAKISFWIGLALGLLTLIILIASILVFTFLGIAVVEEIFYSGFYY